MAPSVALACVYTAVRMLTDLAALVASGVSSSTAVLLLVLLLDAVVVVLTDAACRDEPMS